MRCERRSAVRLYPRAGAPATATRWRRSWRRGRRPRATAWTSRAARSTPGCTRRPVAASRRSRRSSAAACGPPRRGVVVQPAPPDWPGYLDRGRARRSSARRLPASRSLGCALRSGDRRRRRGAGRRARRRRLCRLDRDAGRGRARRADGAGTGRGTDRWRSSARRSSGSACCVPGDRGRRPRGRRRPRDARPVAGRLARLRGGLDGGRVVLWIERATRPGPSRRPAARALSRRPVRRRGPARSSPRDRAAGRARPGPCRARGRARGSCARS